MAYTVWRGGKKFKKLKTFLKDYDAMKMARAVAKKYKVRTMVVRTGSRRSYVEFDKSGFEVVD